jgi:hypothetical protein
VKLRTAIAWAATALLLAVALRAFWPARGGPANVLLITIDTLRADHLHCYGQALATSPNIDALAARGVPSSAPSRRPATPAPRIRR